MDIHSKKVSSTLRTLRQSDVYIYIYVYICICICIPALASTDDSQASK